MTEYYWTVYINLLWWGSLHKRVSLPNN